MSVYVDDAFISWRGCKWCHMQADTIEELHTFASQLGLKRDWFQSSQRPDHDHYDITTSVRVRAIALGAIAETASAGRARRQAIRDLKSD